MCGPAPKSSSVVEPGFGGRKPSQAAADTQALTGTPSPQGTFGTQSLSPNTLSEVSRISTGGA